jgi:hypothetical protein
MNPHITSPTAPRDVVIAPSGSDSKVARVALGVFLVLHGVVHAFFPSYGSSSWLGIGSPAATGLWAATLALFVLAGGAFILRRPSRLGLTVVACLPSLALFGLFWCSGLAVGLAIDLLLLLAALPPLRLAKQL